jgi:hypothetical protein
MEIAARAATARHHPEHPCEGHAWIGHDVCPCVPDASLDDNMARCATADDHSPQAARVSERGDWLLLARRLLTVPKLQASAVAQFGTGSSLGECKVGFGRRNYYDTARAVS